MLLKYGADASLQDGQGYTPLHWHVLVFCYRPCSIGAVAPVAACGCSVRVTQCVSVCLSVCSHFAVTCM